MKDKNYANLNILVVFVIDILSIILTFYAVGTPDAYYSLIILPLHLITTLSIRFSNIIIAIRVKLMCLFTLKSKSEIKPSTVFVVMYKITAYFFQYFFYIFILLLIFT